MIVDKGEKLSGFRVIVDTEYYYLTSLVWVIVSGLFEWCRLIKHNMKFFESNTVVP